MPSFRIAARARRARRVLLAAVLSCIAAPHVAAQSHAAPAALDPDDRVRLAEVRRLAAAVQDSVWPGWSSAPMAFLLVTPEREFLLWHPSPTRDFTRIAYDSLLGTDVWVRPRRFPVSFIAALPAVGGVSTMVVGQPRHTGKASTAWVVSALHEHFHQWQATRDGYQARVAALDLARGDTTGMWMLEYAFPYADPDVQSRVDGLAGALRAALTDGVPGAAGRHAPAIDSARARLRAALAPADHRYIDFQLWQEGIARYTEHEVARIAATHHRPSAEFAALPDFEGYAAVADRLHRGILRESPLGTDKRVAFYPLGAALGLWLDEARPGWRARYLDGMLSLDSVSR